ncbi:SIMPL domain-containing protein [Lysinibacillus yapensis]|uniref:SIMPL domain-containing protein n=1 Tax=Ureibacillus yapensis TaxID=2304605 RepID=UPI001314DE9F|nr:SIMPL domain-containing protein [Lysinibacillus yapensis]
MLDYSTVNQHPFVNVRFISVEGNSKIEVKPDLAELQIEVVTQSENLEDAQSENALKMNDVIQSLLALNIEQRDIRTAFFNVFPRYDYIEGKQVFRGYEVTNALSVEIHDVNDVGLVIDTALKNGANRISQLTFKLENESGYYQQALQMALQDAHEKAIAISSKLKLSYMPLPIEIVEQTSGGRPILFKTAAAAQSSMETPIETGTITIEATLKVKYQF